MQHFYIAVGLGQAFELQVVTVMQDPKQQGIVPIFIVLRDKMNTKMFPDGGDSFPNHASPCNGTANV